jgi:hypothetical protein
MRIVSAMFVVEEINRAAEEGQSVVDDVAIV